MWGKGAGGNAVRDVWSDCARVLVCLCTAGVCGHLFPGSVLSPRLDGTLLVTCVSPSLSLHAWLMRVSVITGSRVRYW